MRVRVVEIGLLTPARLKHVRLAQAVLTIISALFLISDSQAETLVTALSEPTVKITSNFTGAEIVVFGVIERDDKTVERPEPYDIVVTVDGPKETIVIRRKARVFGVWVNNESVRFIDILSFYALHSTRRLSLIADEALLKDKGIGAKNLTLRSDAGFDMSEDDRQSFRDALLRLKVQEGLYAERSSAVGFLSSSLFRTTVPLPANVPDGDYKVDVSLFRGGALLTTQRQNLRIAKAGFEQFTYSTAHTNTLIYGLTTVLMAIFTGWLAGVIFRKE
ncbi:TIGR02186 family protein [Breoghania sp.]|uniref:TIGR02186 family protein n=1 Tax=Breoghania sp. TaxID=2065378 RepID=UPI00260691FE|nr:TIGR02186 family protein [Breoghania sp.]MDJ0932941.1 TIGR02186 family protein [Breoghania sp.]